MSNDVISAEFTGKTVQDATQEGLKTLGLTEEQAKIEVLEEPKKGFLGFGSTKARVLITKIETVEEEIILTDEQRTAQFLEGLFDILGIDAKIDNIENGEKMIINLVSEEDKDLIGKKGEILDSIQTLAGAVANIGKKEYKRVVVDFKNYREIREEKLIALAKKLAEKAERTGRKVKLQPMNPYERRIIHSTLADSETVKTQSEGKEPNRFVVITPNNLKPYSKSARKYSDKPYQKGSKPQGKNYKRKDNDKYYAQKNYGEKKQIDRKKYEQAKKNYENSVAEGKNGVGTGNYVKKESYAKKSYSSFIGTYLGNSRDTDDTSNK